MEVYTELRRLNHCLLKLLKTYKLLLANYEGKNSLPAFPRTPSKEELWTDSTFISRILEFESLALGSDFLVARLSIFRRLLNAKQETEEFGMLYFVVFSQKLAGCLLDFAYHFALLYAGSNGETCHGLFDYGRCFQFHP